MKLTVNEYTRPYALIYFERLLNDNSIYKIISKEGSDIPDLFGVLPPESYFADEEHLIFRFEGLDFKEHREYSLLTTNPNALGKIEKPFYQGETKTLIGGFTLSPDNKACIQYDKYEIGLEFSEDLKSLCLRFYDGFENFMMFYVLGLAEIRNG